MEHQNRPDASELMTAAHLNRSLINVLKEPVKENLLMSTRTHGAADQPVGLFSRRQFQAGRKIAQWPLIPIDLFTLYVFNNIQLPPNALGEAGHRMRLATDR
jgi:hypothetical protein